MSKPEFDAVIIGSGFGGAVSACRLAQAGQKVLVLERGRRWTPENFPREPGDAWLWNQDHPELMSGWADLRTFSDMWVAAGAGVGGGSLIYASVSVEAKPEVFEQGWPAGLNYEVLKPYYERVAGILDVQLLPDNQLNPRYHLMKEAAEACGWGERFHKVPLAVKFNQNYDASAPDPRADHHSVWTINPHGRQQGTCVHCGNCDIGCQVHAKNTLDLNYLAEAENHGAEIRPLHLVNALAPLGGDGQSGWKISFDRIAEGTRIPGSVTAQRVIIAAGSIGSTELLLKSRDQFKTLPRLSARLGHGWAFNGDFVTPTFYKGRKISPSHGPTISSAIDLLDRSVDNQALFIEDGGMPNLAGEFIRRRVQQPGWGKLRKFWKEFGQAIDADDPLEGMMPWFGQAVDAADGQLYLGRPWYAPWRRTLKMDWRYQKSEAVVEAMVKVHKQLSTATGGQAFIPPTWTYLRNLITPHPLGGCNMGDTVADGVVNQHGEVFGYQHLYVMDGATLPRAIGLNPSRTIAALAERGMEHLLQRV
ncbi:MAG: GMC oxidoreductase [Leptothrix sp. (in: b-proteobacteria)]